MGYTFKSRKWEGIDLPRIAKEISGHADYAIVRYDHSIYGSKVVLVVVFSETVRKRFEAYWPETAQYVRINPKDGQVSSLAVRSDPRAVMGMGITTDQQSESFGRQTLTERAESEIRMLRRVERPDVRVTVETRRWCDDCNTSHPTEGETTETEIITDILEGLRTLIPGASDWKRFVEKTGLHPYSVEELWEGISTGLFVPPKTAVAKDTRISDFYRSLGAPSDVIAKAEALLDPK